MLTVGGAVYGAALLPICAPRSVSNSSRRRRRRAQTQTRRAPRHWPPPTIAPVVMRMIPGMIDEAVHWASMEIGAPILRHERLTGGLTSTMLTLIDQAGIWMVLRLMTEEPWKTHGEGLTSRERAAQLELAGTTVPAPKSLSLDARGIAVGVAAHLMTHRPGTPDEAPDE